MKEKEKHNKCIQLLSSFELLEIVTDWTWHNSFLKKHTAFPPFVCSYFLVVVVCVCMCRHEAYTFLRKYTRTNLCRFFLSRTFLFSCCDSFLYFEPLNRRNRSHDQIQLLICYSCFWVTLCRFFFFLSLWTSLIAIWCRRFAAKSTLTYLLKKFSTYNDFCHTFSVFLFDKHASSTFIIYTSIFFLFQNYWNK